MYMLRKITLTITFILLANFIGFAQNLKIADLLKMYKTSTWEDVNSYLSTKGWVFYDSKEGAEILWSYKKVNYENSAQGWLTLKLDGSLFENFTYQISNSIIYASLASETKLLGFKKTNSLVEDGKITSEYSNGKYIISAWINKEKDDNGEYYNLFYIKIMKIRDNSW